MDGETMVIDNGAAETNGTTTTTEERKYDYDLIVIGGGSGGLACGKEAAELGAKVALLDYVKPSPAGTTWGLGGTCVNVGCIPKKLFHYSALLGEQFEEMKNAGWKLENNGHDWELMVKNVQTYIKKLNWGYKTQLRSKKVDYLNLLGHMVDAHTIKGSDPKKGIEKTLTAEKIVVAVGGRPHALNCPGGELSISSDDIFAKKTAPGKTLVVGASYIALECAGFLAALGYDTTVMVRSILLRGFDRDMADKVGAFMEKHKVKFIRGAVPSKLEQVEEDGKTRIKVTYKAGDEELSEVYDTVLTAIGRRIDTDIGLKELGVQVKPNGKVEVNEQEQTAVENVYAIGDAIERGLELTPVAIMAGRLLAHRFYNGKTKLMDYALVPTTVFTPLEYSSCGLSEDEATAKFGEEVVEVYHSGFKPLEWNYVKTSEPDCYVKVIVDTTNDKLLGIHYLGPHAGEVMQGYATALKLGATKEQLDSIVGIHPTSAEELLQLKITKRQDANAVKSGC
mmetsp:Transcript_45129/g.51842  ORF Transcript_45129/g.51842 Transcript_45129/m.51842 type:complete len:508 (+) Transcript_45129:230-1753(+)